MACDGDVLVWGPATAGQQSASGRILPAGWVWTCECGAYGCGYATEDEADAATEHEPEAAPPLHWLIIYDRRGARLLACKEFADGGDAQRERWAIERSHIGDSDLEIVVLSADSLDTLKVTHGRYFCSAGELLGRMEAWVARLPGRYQP